MAALRLLLIPLLIALCALALACKDGGSSGPSATRNGAAASRTAGAGPGGGTTAPDEKSPPPEESPGATAAARTDGTEAPPSPAAEGARAVAPADQNTFVATFQGQSNLREEQCSYSPATRITNCPGRGLFAVDPPLAGEDISCALLTADDQAVAIRCRSQEPLEALYYEIRS
ncbi:MAG: hypothetical protein Q7T33_16065 [Dehalococcoidia bacterium]|nr:hypothetical protein [Dehalococcoidia bacterium]